MSDPKVRIMRRFKTGTPERRVPQMRCPGCGRWQDLDPDQCAGRVSIACGQPGCTFHETHNLLPQIAAALGTKVALVSLVEGDAHAVGES